MSKKRKYQDAYVKFAFTYQEKDGCHLPQCLLCLKVLSNGCMKPSKLQEHLKQVHPTFADEPTEVFEAKRVRFHSTGKLSSHGFVHQRQPIVEASFRVAYNIAKQKKPHSIGEDLIIPSALTMAELVCGKEQAQKLQEISLSNDTIARRISDMSQDILSQVVQKIISSPAKASIQLDESTDVSGMAVLMVYARYLSEEGGIEEDFLMCTTLKGRTTAQDIKDEVDTFFDAHGLSWNHVGSMCTDGAPSMLGRHSGFAALVKRSNPNIVSSHCALHRYALASKTLPPQLKKVLDITVKIVNFVKARALNHRLLKLFLEELGAEHSVLLFHTEVRWLSRGLVIARVFENRDALEIFLREKETATTALHEHFQDPVFVLSLTYLSDIFGHLNEINKQLQGSDMNCVVAQEKVQALRQKLALWQRRIEVGNLANFPLLDTELQQKEVGLPQELRDQIEHHLRELDETFKSYFGDKQHDWTVVDPFRVELDTVADDDEGKDELIDLQNSAEHKAIFREDAVRFWCSFRNVYPSLAKRAFEVLVPFVTTYRCEQAFSVMVIVKTKQRNRLSTSFPHDMRLALSVTKPRIAELSAKKQAQVSH